MEIIKKFFPYKKKIAYSGLVGAVFLSVLSAGSSFTTMEYKNNADDGLAINASSTSSGNITDIREKFVATHVKTPDAVKALYMTSWVAGTRNLRDGLVKIIDDTEANAVVIDIKDYTGKIAFEVGDPYLQEIGSVEKRIPDIKEFIADLHKKDIYVIGRISTFQDSYLVKKRPELAVKRSSDGGVWKDRKGISWLDAGSEDVWKYIVAIGKESYSVGFDELNFDYIRFPSDGNMKDIHYPFSEKDILSDQGLGKAKVLRNFFRYLNENLKDTGAILSADVFGMVTTNTDDLNIGQLLEYALPYFDYIAPMVYPSHYPANFNGYKNPNLYSYEIVKFSMDKAVERAVAASSTPSKLRPWLQDFDYGGNYDIKEVRAQKKAVYDAGLNSWMMWSPSNKYTVGALDAQ